MVFDKKLKTQTTGRQILNYIQLNHEHSAENRNQTPGKQIHVNRLINFGKITNQSNKEEEEEEEELLEDFEVGSNGHSTQLFQNRINFNEIGQRADNVFHLIFVLLFGTFIN